MSLSRKTAAAWALACVCACVAGCVGYTSRRKKEEEPMTIRDQCLDRIWKLQNEIIERAMSRLEGRWTYFETDDLEPLDIVCSDLTLSGEPPLEGVFIQPIPIDELRKIIKAKDALDTELLARDFLVVRTSLVEALCTSDCILDCVNNLGWKTPWRSRRIRKDSEEKPLYGEDYYKGSPPWYVPFIWDLQDTVTPHISPVVIDSLRMEPDKLTAGEFLCILCCARALLRQHCYQCHRIIPVTILSLSMRVGRVVHGYFDPDIQKLRVFKSPILKLSNDEAFENMCRLLTWCLGKPIGKTKWEDWV